MSKYDFMLYAPAGGVSECISSNLDFPDLKMAELELEFLRLRGLMG